MKVMTNKFYLRNNVMLIFSLVLSSQLLSINPANAAKNNYIEITAPTSIKLTGQCVTFSVSYKIMPNFRKSPAVIYLGLSKTRNYEDLMDSGKFAYAELYYNIDMRDFSWDDQNVDFFDKVDLEFCPEDVNSQTVSIVGLTTPGNYYVFAYAKINTSFESTSMLETSWLTASIKITAGTTTITCKKGSVTKKVTSSSPKCPAGFKKVG